MANSTPRLDWNETLYESLQHALALALGYLPQLIAALLLLIFGWLIARLVRLIARRFVHAIDAFLPRFLARYEIATPRFRLLGLWAVNTIYWVIILFFVAIAASILEWRLFSEFSTVMLSYLPRLFTGLLLIFAGLALSVLVRSLVEAATTTRNATEASVLPRVAQSATVVMAVVIGVEQFGINVAFFTTVLIVIIGVLLFGAALAFGLGARQYMANVIGAIDARNHYRVGQTLTLAGVKGTLLDISRTAFVVDTDTGRAIVPAHVFHKHISQFEPDTPEPDEQP
ncbi:mechanosensitive ion channel family protein [Saccharospirillum salsuginis]|nr:hypothetical protein [Saccharospirillum salsuginis]